MRCEDVREKLFLCDELGAGGEEHLRSCDACRREQAALARVSSALAALPAPAPRAALAGAVLRAAAPELAKRRRRADLAQTVRALLAALVPLPVVLAVDVWLIRTLHAFLSSFLPEGLTFYLVGGQVVLVASLFALAYGSIPLLAGRQLRALREVSHA